MVQVIKVKRSDVNGKVPTTADLELGELAINTFDGKLYSKKDDGTESIVDLTASSSPSYTAGTGISIVGSVISSTVQAAGNVIAVQIGDGAGNFGFVPPQAAGRVLTSNGALPPTWELPASTNNAGGATTQVQYNNGGILTGSSAFTFTTGTNTVTATNLSVVNTSELIGSVVHGIVAVADSDVDCSAGNYFTKTVTGAATWTFSNAPASRAYSFTLRLTNGGVGIQTWPASVLWPSGAAPTLTVSGVDLLTFQTDDGGATWRSSALLNYAS